MPVSLYYHCETSSVYNKVLVIVEEQNRISDFFKSKGKASFMDDYWKNNN